MQTEDTARLELHLVVFGRPQARLERHLEAGLRDAFSASGATTDVYLSHYAQIAGTLDEGRQQHSSGPFLHFLDVFNPNEPNSIKLGVIDEDLYSDSHPSLNFIFGEARVGGDSCVISTTRLDPRFYGLPHNERLFHARALKEAVHELGHVLGLAHCADAQCIMHFSNCIEDTDIKRAQPCDACAEKLRGCVKRRGKFRVTRAPGSGQGSRPCSS
ncbi:MAG: archaemetzincin family Zn-dependent metalloprotease [Candidatus Lokiarchaeota archaeon]|nr:archaemetzincin family Zn-dependent metalloprotease [Candidatus Lokiarchaeota archaeon]